MAISNKRRRTTSAGQHLILSLAAASVIGGASRAFAASETWSATPTDSNWTTGANWTPDGVPPGDPTSTTNTDTATFGNTSNGAVTVDANRNLQNLTFSGTTLTAPNTSVYTLTGGPLLLTSGGSLLTTSNTQNINTPIVLEGNAGSYTFESDVASTSRQLVVNGAVSGVSTAGNTTTLTLTGISGSASAQGVFGVISDGTAGGKLALVKNGVNTMSLNALNTYTGGTTINAGVLRDTATGNSTASFGTGTVMLNGGQARLGNTGAVTFNNDLVVGALGGSVSFRANGTFSPTSIGGAGTLSLAVDAAAVVTSANFQNFAGVVDTTGVGTLRLGTGYVTTSLQNARLNLGGTSILNTQFGTNGASTFAIGALSGTGVLGNSVAGTGTFTYSIGSRPESTTFTGTIINGGTKTAITKTGANSLTLTNVNTYTGATTVTGGTLALSGSGSIANSATINVGAAGTLDTTAATFALGGTQALALSGTFKGTLAANAVTTITPGGAGVVGAANVNNTTLASGTTFTADTSDVLTGGDTLNVVGTIDLGGATLALNELATPTIGEIITLINNDGSDPTTGTFNGIANGATVTSGADSFTINYAGGTGNDVTLTATTGLSTTIPEPTTLAVIGLAGLAFKRRRRA